MIAEKQQLISHHLYEYNELRNNSISWESQILAKSEDTLSSTVVFEMRLMIRYLRYKLHLPHGTTSKQKKKNEKCWAHSPLRAAARRLF